MYIFIKPVIVNAIIKYELFSEDAITYTLTSPLSQRGGGLARERCDIESAATKLVFSLLWDNRNVTKDIVSVRGRYTCV